MLNNSKAKETIKRNYILDRICQSDIYIVCKSVIVHSRFLLFN